MKKREPTLMGTPPHSRAVESGPHTLERPPEAPSTASIRQRHHAPAETLLRGFTEGIISMPPRAAQSTHYEFIQFEKGGRAADILDPALSVCWLHLHAHAVPQDIWRAMWEMRGSLPGLLPVTHAYLVRQAGMRHSPTLLILYDQVNHFLAVVENL